MLDFYDTYFLAIKSFGQMRERNITFMEHILKRKLKVVFTCFNAKEPIKNEKKVN